MTNRPVARKRFWWLRNKGFWIGMFVVFWVLMAVAGWIGWERWSDLRY